MKNVNKIIFLLIVLLFTLTLQGVSAIEDSNFTSEIQYVDNNVLSSDIGSFWDLQSLIDNNTVVSLEKNYVRNENETTIVISKNITLNGNGYYIDANDAIRAISVTGNNVVLNNVTIKNGNAKLGGAIYWTGSNGILANSIFINNKATGTDTTSRFEGGGAVYWDGDNGLIANTTFRFNTAAGHGGAIWWNSDNGKLINSIFENNTASKWGGSLYWKGNNGNVTDTNFTNSSGKNGGCLAITGSNFSIDNLIFNSSTSTLGALYWNSVNGVIKNSKFYNNYNSGSTGGGAIYTTSSSNVTIIENCEFVNNGASKNGGAIYAYAKAIVNNSRFYDNYALEFGGAVFFNKESSEVHDSEFINNNASKSGGAIYVSYKTCIVNNSIFKKNNANMGGAIYLSNYKHQLLNSSFEQNTAVHDGGAIYIGSYGTVVNNTDFINNSAERGGALYNYYSGSYTPETSIINSNFKYNNAVAGGAIASFAKFIDINNATLTFNSANYGSAIYMDRTSYTISNSTLLNNRADSVNLTLNFDVDDYSAIANFKVNNTILNAIYKVEGSILLDNVTYWGINGVSNSDDGYIEDTYAINQNVTLIIYNSANVPIYNITNRTNELGSAVFKDLTFNPGNYTLQALHYEDSYYTEITSNMESFSVDGVFSKLVLVNDTIFFGENALVEVSPDATGNVSIFIGKYYTAEIQDGLANISLEGLGVGTYGALIIYSGDDYYDGSEFATQIKIISNRPDAYSYIQTEYVNTVQAGINNTLTLFVQNVGSASGKNVKVRVLSEGVEIANFTVENFEVNQYYKFSLIDTILRPIDNSSVFNVTHKLANYTIIVEDDEWLINITNTRFPIIYNGYLGKDYEYPQEFNNQITRIYDVTGDIIIVNSPYTTYASASNTYRVENFSVSYRNDVIEALLYVPYNWDTIEDGDYNRWHAVFNSEFITPIAHYRDRGNLGGYGNRGYGLVVYNVTEFVKSANNIFELTKVKGGCAVYPSSLVVFTSNSLSNTVKRVYISENADLLSKQYSLNSTVGELTKMDSINTASIIKADLYVFAASAEVDEGNIIFNGNNITNVWNGNSSSIEMFNTDITGNLSKNNVLFFEATGGTVLSLHKIIVVESEKTKQDLNITASADAIVIGENATVVVSGFERATGSISVRAGDGVYFGEIIDGVARVVIPDLIENTPAEVYYGGDDNYNNASTIVDIVVNTKTKENATMNISADEVTEGENVTVDVTLPADASGNVTVGNITVLLNNGTASVTIADLNAGNHTIPVIYSGDDKYNPIESSVNVTVDEKASEIVTASDVVKYFHGSERFVVNVTDSKGRPIVNKTVNITLNGVSYTRVTNENGSASIALGLGVGVYNVTSKVDNITFNSTVIILTTVNGTDIVKVFRNGTQYYATFKDSEGNYLADGTTVRFNINGVFYERQVSGDKGLARLNINLVQGEYILTAINPQTAEESANLITVIPKIVENRNVTKYFRNATQYSVKVLDDEGNTVGAGKEVTFNINGVLYKRSTNESGIARMNINLNPGEYVITAEYDGCTVSNTITVLPTLTASDLTKVFLAADPFVATLVDGEGKAVVNEKVSFNINGVLYTRTTDLLGKARLNINLVPGKYIITSSYGDAVISNTVTVTL